MNSIKKKFGQSTISGKGGGGTTTSNSLNVYILSRGETLLPSGLYGIQRVAEAPTTCSAFLTGSNSELLSNLHWNNDSGLGLMQNVVDGSYIKVCNIDGYSFLQGDALKGGAYGVSPITITISAGSGPISGGGPFVPIQFHTIIYGR
jgi:hypothetical protein